MIVAFEYAAYPPLWWDGDISPDANPPIFPELSPGLLGELNDWVGYGTRHLILEDGMYDGDVPVEDWCNQGLSLARRVQAEAAPEMEVVFVDPVTEARTRVG
jgi:hypothetical protein